MARSVLIAYALWLFLGPLGLHLLYLDRLEQWVIYESCFSLFGLGLAADCFLMPHYVARCNALESADAGAPARYGRLVRRARSAPFSAALLALRGVVSAGFAYLYAALCEGFWVYDDAGFGANAWPGDSRAIAPLHLRAAAYAAAAAAAATGAWLVGNVGDSRTPWLPCFAGAAAAAALTDPGALGAGAGARAPVGLAAAAALGAVFLAFLARRLDGDESEDAADAELARAEARDVGAGAGADEDAGSAAGADAGAAADTDEGAKDAEKGERDRSADGLRNRKRGSAAAASAAAPSSSAAAAPPRARRGRRRRGRWLCSTCCSVLAVGAFWASVALVSLLHARVPVDARGRLDFRGGLATRAVGPFFADNRGEVLAFLAELLARARAYARRRGVRGAWQDLASRVSGEGDYKALGLTRGKATLADVKRAHRQLVKQLHPDKLPADLSDEAREDAAARFRAVQDAYESLSAKLAAAEDEAASRAAEIEEDSEFPTAARTPPPRSRRRAGRG